MNITELLKESFQPEQASLIESAIAQAIEAKVQEALEEAKQDSATAQAQIAQKSADDIENISATYDSEMKKAAKEIVKLEKFYNQQINVAVDKIVTAYDEAERMSTHYEGQLKEAAEKFVAETAQGSLSEAQAQIAEYVLENTQLKEQAQSYGEYTYKEGLAEAQSLVEEATQRFIQENQEKFDRLDEMARMEKIIFSIKEAYEQNALGLSEDEAYKGLQESVEAKQVEVTELQESVESLKAQLLEKEKETAFNTLTKDLSEAQKDKLKTVSESILAENVETFSRTLGFLVEAQTVVTKEAPLDESTTVDESLNTIVEQKQTLNESQDSEMERVKQLIASMK